MSQRPCDSANAAVITDNLDSSSESSRILSAGTSPTSDALSTSTIAHLAALSTDGNAPSPSSGTLTTFPCVRHWVTQYRDVNTM